MRAVIQRVSQAALFIKEEEKANIKNGLVILLGIEEDDDEKDVKWLSSKISKMRIFNDQEGFMNLSVIDVAGDILLVSQFTLHALTKKGNRPSFIKAAKPSKAIPLYESMIKQLNLDIGKEIKTGEFGADMQVNLTNDGPVTIIIDSKIEV